MSTAQLAPGTVLESFTVTTQVRSRVGAITYDAHDASGAAVQVTAYEAACFPSALVLERSLRELRQLATVTSAHVLRVLGCGKLDGGGIWEAHEVIPGPSLAERVSASPLSHADAVAVAQQIGEALMDAQKVGVIHRNLGADVIVSTPEGIRVAGFAVGAPQGGKSFGPLDTIAPEQVEGKVVDQRTLIYNLAALVHRMVRGQPLFDGERDAVLAAHLAHDVPEDVLPALRRGLLKDPRMRPMMLRQFVAELAGVATAGASVPSSRGWTMFTTAAPSEPATPPAAAAPTAPTSRGWTMFTQADEAPAGASAESATAAPATSEPAAPPPESKPSTRGWTMFMQADGTPAPGTASAEPAPAPAPPPAPDAPSKPSTRGWTMFMKAEDGSSAPSPAATPTPAAEPEAAAVAVETTPGGEAKPSTRGWTMFTKDDGTAPPVQTGATQTVPAVDAAAPGGTQQLPAQDGAEAPATSRGWTMFMEPGAQASAVAAAATATPTPAPPAAPTPPSSATPVAPVPPPAEEPATPKRGWTMFMEAPIDPSKPSPLGATPTVPVAEAPSSDGRGWTVFGAPGSASANPPATPAIDANEPPPGPRTMIVTPTPVASPASVDEQGPAAGAVEADDGSDPTPGRGKTIVAPGLAASAGSVGGVTGRTVFPAGQQPPMPDTQYFRRGDIPADRPNQRTTAVDVPAPAMRPAEERGREPLAVPPGRDAPLATTGSNTTVWLVVGGVVLVGAIVGAIVALS